MGVVAKTWAEYAGQTSIHGIPDIQQSKTAVKIVFWLVVFCTCFALAIWEIVMVFEDYKASPVITTYDLISEAAMELPPTQICLSNFVSKPRVDEIRLAPVVVNYAFMSLIEHAHLPDEFEEYVNRSNITRAPVIFANAAVQKTRVEAFEVTKRIARKLNRTDNEILVIFARLEAEVADTVMYPQNVSTPAHKAMELFRDGNLIGMMAVLRFEMVPPQPVDYFNLHYDTSLKYAVDPSTGNVDIEKVLHSVGFLPQEVIEGCWAGAAWVGDCYEEAQPVYDHRYGLCYLIYPTQKQPIAGAGLIVIVRTNIDDAWTEACSRFSGIKVRIEKPYNPTSVNVFAIPVGHKAYIRLKKTHYQLTQSEKYGRCLRDMERTITTYPYSDTSCRIECYLEKIKEVCGCTGPVPKQFRKPGINYVSCAEAGKHKCLGNATAMNVSTCVTKCKPGCEYTDYAPVLSFEKIGNAAYEKHHGPGYDEHIKNITDNRINLDIAYSAMEYMKVEQKDAISIHGLISQVGGQLGLFLGASAISFFQIAAIFIFCFCEDGKKRRHAPNQDNAEPYTKAQIYPIEDADQIQMPEIH